MRVVVIVVQLLVICILHIFWSIIYTYYDIGILENYILIHGSFGDNAARETLEVFYGSNKYQGIITGTIPLNIGKLSVSAYSSLMDSDLFIITGGNKINSGLASNTISYMNVTKLFTNTQMVSVEWDYSCITKYNATQ